MYAYEQDSKLLRLKIFILQFSSFIPLMQASALFRNQDHLHKKQLLYLE